MRGFKGGRCQRQLTELGGTGRPLTAMQDAREGQDFDLRYVDSEAEDIRMKVT